MRLGLRNISEAKTRKEMIDPALARAGRDMHNHQLVRVEISVDGYDAEYLFQSLLKRAFRGEL